MTEQRETRLVVKPFLHLLECRGWLVSNIHGNKHTSGLPDCRIYHSDAKLVKANPKAYGPRWVEFKVLEEDGSIHLTQAQKIKFPQMRDGGELIYIVADSDLRGAHELGYRKRLAHYTNITLGDPNVNFALDRSLWHCLKVL